MDAGLGTEKLGDYGEIVVVLVVCLDLFRTYADHSGRILLVADNYGSHHAKLTQEGADELGIEFVFLPLYSPTLNATKPLWKDAKLLPRDDSHIVW
jgi:hypothetical protein